MKKKENEKRWRSKRRRGEDRGRGGRRGCRGNRGEGEKGEKEEKGEEGEEEEMQSKARRHDRLNNSVFLWLMVSNAFHIQYLINYFH